MDLIRVENNQIILNEQISAELKSLHEAEARMKVLKDNVQNAVVKAMRENGIKSFENDYFKMTYKAPSVRKTIDTQALKEQGLYEMFLKETEVKDSVVITFK